MYKVDLWAEDKWNIHSSSYSSSKYDNSFSDDKKDDAKYHQQGYHDREKNLSSDYLRNESERKDNKGDESSDLMDELQDDSKTQELSDENINFKAAREVFNDASHKLPKKIVKKDTKTIEDAIKKVIEEEKQVIIIDN